MCARYVSPDASSIESEFDLPRSEWRFAANFNAAPAHTVPIIRWLEGRAAAGLARWGMVRMRADGRPGRAARFGARSEALRRGTGEREPWARARRIIIPALGFYDWQIGGGGARKPFFFHAEDQDVFGFAGLWVADEGEVRGACTIITVPANALIAGIRGRRARMPAILARGLRHSWLSGDAESAAAALVPYAPERMVAYPVSPRVNSPANNDEKLIEPMETDVD